MPDVPCRLDQSNLVDHRGVLEWLDPLPFKAVRIYIHSQMKVTRGIHAHKETRRLFFCVKGTACIDAWQGKFRWITANDFCWTMEPGNGAVLVPPGWFTRLHPVGKPVIVVLADREFDAEDYIYPEEKA